MDCCKRKIQKVLAARELYSLNCSLLAKQILYLYSCSQKNRGARHARRNARKDHSSPLLETAYSCETGYPFDDSRH